MELWQTNMRIEERRDITVRKVYEGFVNDEITGAWGLNGRLNIRPAFQREFVYNIEQKKAVIRTALQGFPLNSIYFMKIGTDDNGREQYELLDGQQRLCSLCEYVQGSFSVDIEGNPHYFTTGLTHEWKERLLDYRLNVYVCEGDELERLRWFEIINTQGEKLKNQEMRNAVYLGSWTSDMKRRFIPESALGKKQKQLLSGTQNRADFMETVIRWEAHRDGLGTDDNGIKEYMNRHRDRADAEADYDYFLAVTDWAAARFPNFRPPMKGLPWGVWYNQYRDLPYDAAEDEKTVAKLMKDEEVQKKSGIYEYVLTGSEAALNLRAFTQADKETAYERQGGVCPKCHQRFALNEMEADHVVPWSRGGKTVLDNCQMLCKKCNRMKSAREN